MKNSSLATIVAAALLSFVPGPNSVAVQFWDPNGATPGTSVSGNWDTVTLNWTPAVDSGVSNVWAQGDDANFALAAAYTVTLTEPITVAGVTATGTAGGLTIVGTAVNNLTLAAPSAFNVTNSTRTNTVTAPMVGGGGLSKTGNGALVLAGANTYSGGTTLSGGTIGIGSDSVSAGGVITSGPLGTGNFVFSVAATVFASGAPRVVHNPVILNGGLTNNGSFALTFTNGDFKINGATRNIIVNNTADLTIGGNLIDDLSARNLQKFGNGRLVLAGNNSTNFQGQIVIMAGTVSPGTPTGLLTSNAVTVSVGTTLDLNGIDATLFRLTGGSATTGGGSILLGTNMLTVGNSVQSGEFFGVISGTGRYVKVGTISQVLTGTNTFTGGILIKDGPIYFPTNGVTGSPIALGAGPNTITITNTGSFGANRGISILTNRVVLANDGPTCILDSVSGTQWILAGEVSGSGGLLRTFAKGGGSVELSGDNTFTGGVQMDGRGLTLGHPRALGTGTLTIGNPTNPPTASSPLLLATSVDLTGANAITNPVTINLDFINVATNGIEFSGPVTLSSGTKAITNLGSALAKISGVIGGSGGLNKAGTLTLTFSANNSNTGPTIVSEGTLALTGSGSLAGSSDITVLSGATLDVSGRTDGTLTVGAAQKLGGSGTIIGAVAVAGTMAPGTSPGTLTITGNLGLTGKALFEIDRSQSPSNDFVVVSGTLSGGGTLTVTNSGESLLQAGDSFTLFSKPVSGFTTVNLPVGYSWTNQLASSGGIAVIGTTFPTTPTNITPSLSGGNLTITWPANYAGGWVLETSLDLANWTTVPGSRDVNSMSFPVTAEPAAFYRLRLLTQ